MAVRSTILLALMLVLAAGLQVTPNSPCTSFCIDSNDLDFSDPNSSNTRGSDITCNDADYNTKAAGQKFQRCMTCLQTSTFSQGKENDQQWFLYNLRYSFDYCVFGYPNATDVGSNPCQTSTACGSLEIALKDGELDPLRSPQYGYCQADGGAMTSDAFGKCLACVRASSGSRYIANFLVALEAGCRQLPAPGKTVGLNDTVFTKTLIGIVDPSATSDANASKGPALPTTTAVGIAVGAVVVLLLAGGCGYVQFRKRRNRRARDSGVNPHWHRTGHRPQSSLSFRCQTHLSPRSPRFPGSQTSSPQQINSATFDDEKHQASAWDPEQQEPPRHATPAAVAQRDASKRDTIMPLQTITTSIPNMPSQSRLQSPRYGSSPADDYTTPTSTVSVRSTTALLPIRPYVPADHAQVHGQMHVASATSAGMPSPPLGSSFARTSFSFGSPVAQAGGGGSPQLHQGSWPLQAQQQQQSGTAAALRTVGRGPPSPKRFASSSTGRNSGSPVESRDIQMSFAPPPTSSRR